MEVSQEIIGRKLKLILKRKKEQNKNYSLRAFARDINMSSGALSLIINGKRKISESLAQELVQKLKLEKIEKEEFLRPFSIQEEISNLRIDILTAEQEEVLSINWNTFLVYSFLGEGLVLSTPRTISNYLKIDSNDVQEIFDNLFQADLIRWDEKGRLIKTHKNALPSLKDFCSSSFQQFILQNQIFSQEDAISQEINKLSNTVLFISEENKTYIIDAIDEFLIKIKKMSELSSQGQDRVPFYLGMLINKLSDDINDEEMGITLN